MTSADSTSAQPAEPDAGSLESNGAETAAAATPAVALERVGHVALVELRRPPHNFLSIGLVAELARALEDLDADVDIRCVVLAAKGKSFCAGADFSTDSGTAEGLEGAGDSPVLALYDGAARLFDIGLPVIAAVHGAAIGGGLGLALAANLRVTCPEARFSANFARLGIHHGFGLSVTLPELVGPARAARILFTARRFNGEEAAELGLADLCVPRDQVRQTALDLAREIAEGAPLALRAINRTLRLGMADRVREATRREAAEQEKLLATADALEGIVAMSERRPGNFTGR